MIVVKLTGGFGNQLFQYAAGLSLSKHHNVDLKVDITTLNAPDSVTGTIRKADILNLQIPPTVATEGEINKFRLQSRHKKLAEKLFPFYKRQVYKDASNKFDKKFFSASANKYLIGNRQSEKYFKPYENHIKNNIILSDEIVFPIIKFSETLKEQNSVSIHIRRGDYLTPVAMEWLGLLPLSYYLNSIKTILDKLPNAVFYIFSDDIDWVKNNLIIENEHHFVSNKVSKNAMEDFFLMSCCRHNIIANSTFSWWAAWLNAYEEKTIIAPNRWYNMEKLNNMDLIPESWIKI